MGFHGGPLWRDGAVYLPCYAPLYADARTILPAPPSALIDQAPGRGSRSCCTPPGSRTTTSPRSQRLAARIAPYAAGWDELLADVGASAGGAGRPQHTTLSRPAGPGEPTGIFLRGVGVGLYGARGVSL